MAGAFLKFEFDVSAAQAALAEAKARALDLRPALRSVGRAGVNQSRLRFRTKTAPDGTPWKPTLKIGGTTLIQSGLLLRSIYSAEPEARAVEWGSNRVYAAIHQFGGVIRAKSAGALRFQINGRWAMKASVKIPARPYLGVNADDQAEFADILMRHVGGPIGGQPA